MRSGRTISQCFHRVLNSICKLQDTFFALPVPIAEDCTDSRWRWFKGCLGALDGTYIDVRVPDLEKCRYRTRKGHVAVNVLGVCNMNMQFIYVLTGWEGSAADSRVLRDAITRPHGLRVPTGKYYLCDNGYMNGDGFLAPYRGVRYHLREWDRGTIGPQNKEELFNLKHSSARNVIERTFGLLKLEGHILHVFPNSDITKIHVWKKQYATLISMMSKSGFGWDEGKNMITVEENSIWDEYVKVDPAAKSMRFKLFLYFSAWREIFRKDRATGERAKDGKATADAVCEEEAMETQDDYVPTADWNPEEGFVSNDGDLTRAQMNIDPTTHSSLAPKPNYEKPKKRKKPQVAPEDRLLDMVSSFCQDANARLGTRR
ncbi:UNVERIFIED_CONTAM: hypothetical protein Sradi_3810700 [Sesamum radiatum]|uniref:DDE Tnp4 domain-containing protein n=1 Tax=Sesamum radiatum TaxID=300843 RepID=A0AAW2Q0L8_SESRA